MQPITRHIIYAALAAAFISSGYYLSLVIHLPFIIFIGIVIASIACYSWFQFQWSKTFIAQEKTSLITTVLLAATLLSLTISGWTVAEKYGVWDAMGIWNYHAAFLTDPIHWSRLFLTTTNEHPDYPMLLPGCIAFCWRLLGNNTYVVPLSVCFWVMLAIAALIFIEIRRRSLFFAIVAVLLMTTNSRYINVCMFQYADTLAAFFLLAAAICMNYFKEQNKVKYLVFCAACLGSAIWTKNEGLLFSIPFILFHWREIFSKINLIAFLGGLFPFIIVVLVHKIFYAPANDMVAGLKLDIVHKLCSPERAWIILQAFCVNLKDKFNGMTCLVLLYVIWSAITHKRMAADAAMLLSFLVAIFLVYMVTPNDLPWHLETSLDRLFHQIFPVTIYLVAMRVTRYKPALALV